MTAETFRIKTFVVRIVFLIGETILKTKQDK